MKKIMLTSILKVAKVMITLSFYRSKALVMLSKLMRKRKGNT